MWIWIHTSSDYAEASISNNYFATKQEAWEHFVYDWDQVVDDWKPDPLGGFTQQGSMSWSQVKFEKLTKFEGFPDE